MKMKMMAKATKLACRVGQKISKHLPEILVVSGLVGGVATTVVACKKTPEAEKIMAKRNETLTAISKGAESGNIDGVEYTKEQSVSDTRIVNARTALQVVKVYSVPALMGAVSVLSVVTGHGMLRRRYKALSAAYTALGSSYLAYRNNVVKRYGEKTDYELLHGLTPEVMEIVTSDENNKEKVEKKTVYVQDGDNANPYAFWFAADTCPEFDTNYQYDMMWLRAKQEYANQLLHTRGHLYLNEVLRDLNMDPVYPIGQIAGWTDKTSDGTDGYVDFRISNVIRTLPDGVREPTIMLNFNVEGNILDKM